MVVLYKLTNDDDISEAGYGKAAALAVGLEDTEIAADKAADAATMAATGAALVDRNLNLVQLAQQAFSTERN